MKYLRTLLKLPTSTMLREKSRNSLSLEMWGGFHLEAWEVDPAYDSLGDHFTEKICVVVIQIVKCFGDLMVFTSTARRYLRGNGILG